MMHTARSPNAATPVAQGPTSLWEWLVYYAKQHWKPLGIAALLVIVAGGYPSFSNYILKIIIDRVAEAPKQQDIWMEVGLPALLLLACFEGINITWRCYDYAMLKCLPNIRKDVVARMYRRIEAHNYQYFVTHYSGNISNKISDMARSFTQIIEIMLYELLQRAAVVTIAIVSMVMVHPYFSLAMIVWACVMIAVCVACMRLFNRYVYDFSNSRSKVFGTIVDCLLNILSIKLYGATTEEGQELESLLEETAKKDRSMLWLLLIVRYVQGISLTVMITSVTGVLIYLRQDNLVTVGDFAFVISLASVIARYVWQITRNLGDLSEMIGLCTQALTVLDPDHTMPVATTAPLHIAKGTITFDHVSFGYGKESLVLNDLSFTIPAGQKVGIVGLSGCGKSTLVSLIPRLHEVTKGAISIDDQLLPNISLESLHQAIAFVPQSPVLFQRSVLENIRYGSPHATEEEVIRVAEQMGAHDFISKLPKGYATKVGTLGVKLSGGQRQLILLARALLRNDSIMILDEATSSLDGYTEAKMLDRLLPLLADKTVLMVTHRLPTLRLLDRLIVLDQGRIIEDGNHEELLANRGLYWSLWNLVYGLPSELEPTEGPSPPIATNVVTLKKRV
jgi:ATP-binding cassette subfamily B protein